MANIHNMDADHREKKNVERTKHKTKKKSKNYKQALGRKRDVKKSTRNDRRKFVDELTRKQRVQLVKET
jgi:hypothetical protein